MKKIFELMYKKLTELAIGNRFYKWIKSRRNTTFKKIKKRGDNYLFEMLILTIFSGGFRAKIVDAKWPFIKEAFDNFNIQKIANYDEKKIVQLIKDPNIIRFPNKIRAVVDNAKKLITLQKEYDSFANYLKSFEGLKSFGDQLIFALDLAEEFKFLGRETVWDFLINIGFDAIKPDVHVRRILFRLGLISSEKSSYKIIKEVFEVAKKISEATGEPLGVIDAVIWFYGADRPEEIKKTICGLKPLCNECYLTKFCKYYRKNKKSKN